MVVGARNVAGASMRERVGWRVRGGGAADECAVEQCARIGGAERVAVVAELARRADRALLGQDGLDFAPPEEAQGAGNAFFGAAAGKARRSRLVQADVEIGELRVEQV